MSLVLDEHRELVEDVCRLRAYEAALTAVVRPDHVVLDLGAGTGILGLLACRAGARRVYSVDDGGILQTARAICRGNALSDRVVHIKALSTRVNLPEQVDVVVADQIGRFGFEAGIITYFNDARARLMKPGGLTIPQRIDLVVAPVRAPEMRRRIDFWKSPILGFDLTAALPTALNTGYPVKFTADQILGPPATIAALDFAAPVSESLSGEATLVADRDGTLDGIGGWFDAQLSAHVSMTNSPLSTPSIARRNVFFPIASPVDVSAGDRIHVAMHIIAAELLVRWHVEVTAPDGRRRAVSTHSTWSGMLLCREDLERTRPDRIARLTPWGVARRTVLELCDGLNTAAAIEQALRARHPDLFPSPAEAARFVAEVVVPYSV